MTQSAAARPTGVTVLAILAALNGIFSVIGGLALAGLSAAVGALGAAGPFGALAGVGSVLGITVAILGVVGIIWAVGAYRLRPWAWTLGIVVYAISVLMAIITTMLGGSVDVLTIALGASVLFYLTRPHVKDAFGR